jgi:hypothetical protein
MPPSAAKERVMRTKTEKRNLRSLRIALALLAVPGLLAMATTTADAGHGTGRQRGRTAAVLEARHETQCRHHDRFAGFAAAFPTCRPVWCANPSQVLVWKDHPFFLHAGFGIYFGGPAIAADLCNVPPAGCAYIDPFCHRTFGSIAAYHRHLRHRHHAPLVQVMIDFG